MKFIRVLFTLLFILISLSISCICADISNFIDVSKDAWYYDYVAKLTADGIINGTSPTTFAPNDSFSFAECSAVVTRYLGLDNIAKQYAKQMSEKSIPGSNSWFCGYIQVLHETGVMDAQEYGFETIDGFVCINNPEIFTAPISRMDFAYLTAKSFEISGTLMAQNLPVGVGGYGYDFIATGAYDDSIFYYAQLINDYNSIPETHASAVLKMYYNGIFAGDNIGNFNPHSNLTRAEMAKVICVINNFDMRTLNDLRTLPPPCVLSDTDFFINATGNKQIAKDASFRILSEIVNKSIKYENGVLTYTQTNLTPMGYSCDAYIYTNGKSDVIGLSKYGANYATYSQSYDIQNNSFEVILVLRNLSNSCEIDGALSVKCNSSGEIVISDMSR